MAARGSTEPVKPKFAAADDFSHGFTPVSAYNDNGGSGVTPQPAASAGFILSVWAVISYVLTSHTAWFDLELAALCTVVVNAGIAWRIHDVVTADRGIFGGKV